jgi:hypothetical protein
MTMLLLFLLLRLEIFAHHFFDRFPLPFLILPTFNSDNRPRTGTLSLRRQCLRPIILRSTKSISAISPYKRNESYFCRSRALINSLCFSFNAETASFPASSISTSKSASNGAKIFPPPSSWPLAFCSAGNSSIKAVF